MGNKKLGKMCLVFYWRKLYITKIIIANKK